MSLVTAVGAPCCALLVSFVPSFEGMVLRGYRDPIGIVTACAGNTRSAVLGKPYTRAECDELLMEDLADHAIPVMDLIKVPTSVGERAAFISFAFNVGVGNFQKSTLLVRLNDGDYAGACNELLKWDRAGGKVLKGLTRRRQAEWKLCNQGGERS